MIHVEIPFSPEKRLGKAYNQSMAAKGDDDWVCFLDHDVLILTPETINHFYRYTELNPDAGLLTCFTNRCHRLSKEQRLDGVDEKVLDIGYHNTIARNQERNLYKTTEIKEAHRVSGFLMLVSKRTWQKVKFNEERGCLWVDTDFCNTLIATGKKILRMDGIYVWHSYRVNKDMDDKSHLL